MKITVNFLLVALIGVPSVLSDRHITRDKRQAMRDYAKWENNKMSLFFYNLPLEMQAMFRDAINYLENHTCLKFEYNENAETAVRIRKGNGCYSLYGMHAGEVQDLTLDYNCASFGTAVHEIMHALGIAHGQARSDRDDYLIVDSTNSNDGIENTENLVPFDYGSVMLYARDPHSDKRIPIDPEYNFTMGSLRVAFYDMVLLNKFYGCNCDNHPRKLDCKNGGYQNPANCEECLCTDGFNGQLCDQHEGVYVLEAKKEWDASGVRNNYRKGIETNTMPEYTYFALTAPEGSTIEVRITKLSGFFCQHTCDYNGVELKYKTDRRIVSPLVCCDNDNLWNKTRSSTNNPFIIAKYGNNRTPHFEFEYRYIPGNATAAPEENN
ncbi:Zinc metalloproteinase nas-20 [Caenorhabditis elegans]|uniref:Zinc metalloproteinase nas-20 n=1 Tax=Caenorhabditis elegans TaxID=6239 RepID=NAS20_CAEEL|nr:Zinc metalloproteinase nas-20 [Caenorhabditis elegans]Q22396.2 RecName: Full=Zinc metalloproteinase nas-20; AltName: Full=Nematode astacin 20; Flags: Precursor [Caenorhabditis elegans]CAA98528.2 Zinc metalloproteinase nas-20 [Caenorhabditis elegans]|eukprot:NP_505906.2 Zinc metalloproteinase nas-20 [Caenorhabditis elegans]